MRIVLQRVARCSVSVGGEEVVATGPGLLLLVGVGQGDDEAVAQRMAEKVLGLRIFPGEGGRGFDVSLRATGGEAIVVSQFTLLGDVRRGNRPSWAGAAAPADAEPVLEAFAGALAEGGVGVRTGIFGADMQVGLVNDGPVTLVLDSGALKGPRRGADGP